MSGATWRNSHGQVIIDEAKIRQRYRSGLCVCCGGMLSRPHTIGEEVQICGRCSDGGHLHRPGEVKAVLLALLRGGPGE